MTPLERLESLAVEVYGRGAAISLDRKTIPGGGEMSRGWEIIVWSPKGEAMLAARMTGKAAAVRACLERLREKQEASCL